MALFSESEEAINQVYNVACGDQVTLNDMVDMLKRFTGKNIEPLYGPERPRDVRHSRADISKIKRLLGYEPKVFFQEGLEEVYKWYQNHQNVLDS